MTLAFSTTELAERYHKGESMASLARSYQCSRGTILYRLNQAGARSRTRARVNSRVMLSTYRPVLLTLLAQLEKALETVREEFIANADNAIRRKGYLSRINRLEEQIAALKALTTK